MVQWLGLYASNAEGPGLIPGWETKVPQATRHAKKKKKEYRRLISYLNLFGKDRVCTVLQSSSTFPQWGYKQVVNYRDFQKTRMNTDPSSAF